MPNAERVLASHRDAAWLPEGGRADVVLADVDAEVPAPTCLVRLLATRDDQVLTVPRADGDGLDIPTQRVARGAHADALRTLMTRVLGGVHPSMLLGYVRNAVPEAPDDYPWPSPDAYFAVWQCRLPEELDPAGVWLDAETAATELSARHWWPLAAHLPMFVE
jgi:hypothetical protein